MNWVSHGYSQSTASAVGFTKLFFGRTELLTWNIKFDIFDEIIVIIWVGIIIFNRTTYTHSIPYNVRVKIDE